MTLKLDFDIEGIMLDFERFAIHDGPGIRTVVFMKGCPLRCMWCSTSDGQNCFLEVEYFTDKCMKCGKCVETCPVGANKKSHAGKIMINRRKCNACGTCEVCPRAQEK